MKIWKLLLIACTLSTSISVLAAEPADGIDRGNGGDEYSQEFVAIGYELVESLMKEPLAGVDPRALLQAVERTKVKSTSQRLILRGQEVSAINDPRASPPTILLSQRAWQSLVVEPHRRVFLAFHEYLGILGLDDSNYQISLRLDRANVCGRHPAIRADIESELKKSCYRVIPDDLRYVKAIYIFPSMISDLVTKDFKGLENLARISFPGNQIRSIEPNFFSNLKKLSWFQPGSSIEKYPNCAILGAIKNLKDLWLSDSAYEGNPAKFRPIAQIQRSCLAGKNLDNIFISFDGANSEYAGFLDGASAKNITVDGLNLHLVRVQEFSGKNSSYITLKSYDRKLTKDYSDQLGNATNLKCTLWENGKIYSSIQCNQ